MVQAAVGPPKSRMTVPAAANMKLVTPVQITGAAAGAVQITGAAGAGARTIQLPSSGVKSGSGQASTNIPVARVTPQQHTSVSVTTGQYTNIQNSL